MRGRERISLAIGVISLVAAIMALVTVKRTGVRAQVAPAARPSRPVDPLSPETPLAVARHVAPALQPKTVAARGGTTYQARPMVSYDTRPFAKMADAWEKEADDAEWSLNIKTFIGAMIETFGDGPDAGSLDAIEVRCRQSVCRIDAEASELATLAKLQESSRPQQPHVTYELAMGDAGPRVEAFLGRERGDGVYEQ